MQEKSGLEPGYRGWQYETAGDYHRNLDLNWSYAPTYLQKMAIVRKFIESQPPEANILDIACGEGILVEEFHSKGRNIQGIDLNYESEFVKQGDVCSLTYLDASVDIVLFLDALEHLTFIDQSQALQEIHRILRPQGTLFLTVPNLAHFNSRIQFLFRGKLDRTDAETDHLGERPIWENQKLLEQHQFEIVQYSGLTFTLPIVYSRLIRTNPAKFRWLHDMFEPFARSFPSFAMFNYFICRKI
jgi:ubiquinone/menaquinone biosynthesis C-methylase UbiE